MSTLREYISSRQWNRLYIPRQELDDAVIFLYRLFDWLVRDEADYLKFNDTLFEWWKGETKVNHVQIKIPPDAGFKSVFRFVLDRDPTIAGHFHEVGNGEGEWSEFIIKL